MTPAPHASVLEEGSMYRIVMRGRRAMKNGRASLMTFLGIDHEGAWQFSARPVAGTQTIRFWDDSVDVLVSLTLVPFLPNETRNAEQSRHYVNRPVRLVDGYEVL